MQKYYFWFSYSYILDGEIYFSNGMVECLRKLFIIKEREEKIEEMFDIDEVKIINWQEVTPEFFDKNKEYMFNQGQHEEKP